MIAEVTLSVMRSVSARLDDAFFRTRDRFESECSTSLAHESKIASV